MIGSLAGISLSGLIVASFILNTHWRDSSPTNWTLVMNEDFDGSDTACSADYFRGKSSLWTDYRVKPELDCQSDWIKIKNGFLSVTYHQNDKIEKLRKFFIKSKLSFTVNHRLEVRIQFPRHYSRTIIRHARHEYYGGYHPFGVVTYNGKYDNPCSDQFYVGIALMDEKTANTSMRNHYNLKGDQLVLASLYAPSDGFFTQRSLEGNDPPVKLSANIFQNYESPRLEYDKVGGYGSPEGVGGQPVSGGMQHFTVEWRDKYFNMTWNGMQGEVFRIENPEVASRKQLFPVIEFYSSFCHSDYGINGTCLKCSFEIDYIRIYRLNTFD